VNCRYRLITVLHSIGPEVHVKLLLHSFALNRSWGHAAHPVELLLMEENLKNICKVCCY
jgi:hypothetical protein